jgi:hypothetical protein
MPRCSETNETNLRTLKTGSQTMCWIAHARAGRLSFHPDPRRDPQINQTYYARQIELTSDLFRSSQVESRAGVHNAHK